MIYDSLTLTQIANWNSFKKQLIVIRFRIAHYGTVSTDESVLIIGGITGYTDNKPDYTSVIAEYKDESWKNVGNLVHGRCYHSAITSEYVTMVVGGQQASGST